MFEAIPRCVSGLPVEACTILSNIKTLLPPTHYSTAPGVHTVFVCVFCLALTPLLAFAHIQYTAHRQTANRSGPLLPGLCCAPVVCLSPSSLRYRHEHKSLPLFVSMHRWAWDVMSRKASSFKRRCRILELFVHMSPAALDACEPAGIALVFQLA